MDKKLVVLGMVVGSTIGSYVPALWGADIFSWSALLGGLVGGIFGIYFVVKVSI